MEYAIILPLKTASVVSQRVLVVISGVLVVSRKNAHSCSKYVIKSGSFMREILRHHLGGGAWPEIILLWMLHSIAVCIVGIYSVFWVM